MYRILRKILEELTIEQRIEMLINLYDNCDTMHLNFIFIKNFDKIFMTDKKTT